MLYTIETAHLIATIETKGAELQSLTNKENGIEYIWQGDPQFWGKRSPLLFPFVGAVKDETYTYQRKSYTMPRHGFARDLDFTVLTHESDRLVLALRSTEATLQMYPFAFELRITYTLGGDGLVVAFAVENLQDDVMYFSLGGHPAFNVPLTADLTFEDYYLETHPMKSRVTIPVEGAFIDLDKRTLAQTNTRLSFTREMFKNDALIFETKGLNAIDIRSEKSPHSVTLSYFDWPFVGIWSPYPAQAPFVCIEPWQGIADTTTSTGELTEKFGVQQVAGLATFTTKYAITVK